MSEVAKWNGGQTYRGRAVVGQVQIEVLANEKRTRVCEVMLECNHGPMSGRRMKWRGWLNSESNVEKTRDALVAMGWRAAKWGDWTGIGSKEVEWKAMAESSTDDEGKPQTFWRAAFVRTVATLRANNPATTRDLDDLNVQFGGLLGGGAPASSPAPHTNGVHAPPAPVAGDAHEGDEIPF